MLTKLLEKAARMAVRQGMTQEQFLEEARKPFYYADLASKARGCPLTDEQENALEQEWIDGLWGGRVSEERKRHLTGRKCPKCGASPVSRENEVSECFEGHLYSATGYTKYYGSLRGAEKQPDGGVNYLQDLVRALTRSLKGREDAYERASIEKGD
jgi:hypothetical protein